ncbi:MAG: hypothetical protein JRG89_22220 [Deltaproteobacteria bacterium]|nr:hypothetical protein [Deltaproteobacteria bacterium]
MTAARQIESAATSALQSRERLHERSDAEIVRALASVFDLWRDSASACRRELEAKLPLASGFAPATLRAGLELGFEPWTGEAFERLVADELGLGTRSKTLRVGGYPLTSVLLAGSIPMPSVLSMLLPLVLRSAVLCKPASRDPITPSLVLDSLREVDPLLADCVGVVPFDKGDVEANKIFYASPCVVATGSGETISEVESYLAPHQRRVLYGHRVSIAVIEMKERSDEKLAELAHDLAIDIALWDQLGCLSPVAFYLVGGTDGTAEVFAEALAAALASAQERWPRGAVTPETASSIARERSEAEMRKASRNETQLIASAGTEWTVVLEGDTSLRPAPLHRFIRLVPVPGLDSLPRTLEPLAPHLAGVALAGFEAEREEVTRRFFELGASLICKPGRLQIPPLDWRRDNQPLLLGMAMLGNREGG